jgi:hypothetical membrane protein
MTAAPDNSKSTQLLTRASLLSAACMPIIYFGAQLAAAPFYPGYSFSNQIASMLGTSYSRQPWIFNTGIILTGIAAIVAAYGLFQSFRTMNNLRLSSLIALSVVYSGFLAVRAGLYPLPDPRHSSLKFGLTSPLLTTLLMLIATWEKDHLKGLRTYLFASVLLLVPVVVLLKGTLTIPWLPIGTLQRLLALGTYVPIGVVGVYFFLQDRQRLE